MVSVAALAKPLRIVELAGASILPPMRSVQFNWMHLLEKRKPEARSNLVEGYVDFSKVTDAWLAKAAAETGKSGEDVAFALLQALQQDFCVVEIALSRNVSMTLLHLAS